MSRREWIAAVVTGAVGVALALWLVPLAARLTFAVPADVYARFPRPNGYRSWITPLAQFLPTLTGGMILVVCIVVYCWWTGLPVRYQPRR